MSGRRRSAKVKEADNRFYQTRVMMVVCEWTILRYLLNDKVRADQTPPEALGPSINTNSSWYLLVEEFIIYSSDLQQRA